MLQHDGLMLCQRSTRKTAHLCRSNVQTPGGCFLRAAMLEDTFFYEAVKYYPDTLFAGIAFFSS